jgi:hypothetical protein
MHMNAHCTNHLNEPWTPLNNQTCRQPVLYVFKYHLLMLLHFITHELKICTVMTSSPLVDKFNTQFPYIFASSFERSSKQRVSSNNSFFTPLMFEVQTLITCAPSLHQCCSKYRTQTEHFSTTFPFKMLEPARVDHGKSPTA